MQRLITGRALQFDWFTSYSLHIIHNGTRHEEHSALLARHQVLNGAWRTIWARPNAHRRRRSKRFDGRRLTFCRAHDLVNIRILSKRTTHQHKGSHKTKNSFLLRSPSSSFEPWRFYLFHKPDLLLLVGILPFIF